MKITFCIIQIVMPTQKYGLTARALSALPTGIFAAFARASITTVSLQREKQKTKSTSPTTAQMLMTSTHAICVSPKTLTSGSVAETERIRPHGERHIRVIESISRSFEARVIIAESEPYGRFSAV